MVRIEVNQPYGTMVGLVLSGSSRSSAGMAANPTPRNAQQRQGGDDGDCREWGHDARIERDKVAPIDPEEPDGSHDYRPHEFHDRRNHLEHSSLFDPHHGHSDHETDQHDRDRPGKRVLLTQDGNPLRDSSPGQGQWPRSQPGQRSRSPRQSRTRQNRQSLNRL